MRRLVLVPLLLVAQVTGAVAAPLTADDAVRIALQHNTQVIQSNASVLSSKGSMWSAYSSVLPNVGVTDQFSRTQAYPEDKLIPGSLFGFPYTFKTLSSTFSSTSPSVSASWGLLNLASWRSVQAASRGLQAARESQRATRSDVTLEARRLFYEVVKAYHLGGVATGALKLSRDDERRVRALFEVGSVSQSDLLKARVRTSQSELDSLVANHAVTNSRIQLATWLGVDEPSLGDVDTTLTHSGELVLPDAAAILAEARQKRPDVRAAELEVQSASAGLSAANFARLPYASASASYALTSRSKSSGETQYVGHPIFGDTTISSSSSSRTDPSLALRLSVNLDVFSGFAIESRIASSRASLMRARETRDALLRNLDSEVRQALLGYQEAVEREALARRTLESASENLNLVQQKYNVGSATILDLIDSQVQLQSAQSSLVTALAAIRVAQATLDRVRGGE